VIAALHWTLALWSAAVLRRFYHASFIYRPSRALRIPQIAQSATSPIDHWTLKQIEAHFRSQV
jgi:hypothetical protein